MLCFCELSYAETTVFRGYIPTLLLQKQYLFGHDSPKFNVKTHSLKINNKQIISTMLMLLQTKRKI